MKRIVILISGRGSNMSAIINALQKEKWPAQIVAVISNTDKAKGIVTAQQSGIETQVVLSRQYDSREAYDQALMKVIDSYAPDLIVLAGYMRILTPAFVLHYEGRLINIHPALLPSFKGLHTHQRAIDEGVKVHGATVHFVVPELDAGPIIAQTMVPVYPNDNEEALADRVLEQEHLIYPRVVRWFINDLVQLKNGKVILSPSINKPSEYLILGDFS